MFGWQCNSSKNMAFAVFSYNYKPLPSDRAAINALYPVHRSS